MSATDITKATVWEDAGATCMARIAGSDGNNITSADVSTITCAVFDLNSSTPNEAVATPTVGVALSVFDSLQMDSRWSTDSTGYNFRHTITAAMLSTGGHRYLVEYKITPVSGEVYWVVYELYAKAVRTS